MGGSKNKKWVKSGSWDIYSLLIFALNNLEYFHFLNSS